MDSGCCIDEGFVLQQEQHLYPSKIEQIIVEPGFDRWRDALSERSISEHAEHDRRILGLPVDAPIVMSGHQAMVFHPGIVAKIASLMHAAEQTGARPVWIIPDQDAIDPMTIRIPEWTGDKLGERTVQIADPPRAGIAGASIEPSHSFAAEMPAVLDELVDYLSGYSAEGSLAGQFGNAVVALACQWLGREMPIVLLASDLSKTNAFRSLIKSMRSDPHACVQAYNDASRAFPDAGVRMLEVQAGRIELPLWRIRPGEQRMPVYADQIEMIPDDELIARGLTMTALVRGSLCELFIHGTGGWNYDRVTEHWIKHWRGTDLSPMAHVTATQVLDLGDQAADLPAPARARWLAQAAKHNPGLVGDDRLQQTKQELVDRIQRRKEMGENPRASYRELLDLLERHRTTNSTAIAALDAQAAEAQASVQQHKLTMDRTWPFVCFDAESGFALMERVRSSMS